MNSTTDVYIGGLPQGWKQEQLLGWLSEQGVQVDLSSFSSRRAYAIVSLQTELAPKLLALDAVKIEQTQLVVQPVGEAPMNRLIDVCKAQGIQFPDITVHENHAGLFTGTAVWQA